MLTLGGHGGVEPGLSCVRNPPLGRRRQPESLRSRPTSSPRYVKHGQGMSGKRRIPKVLALEVTKGLLPALSRGWATSIWEMSADMSNQALTA
jgi:hypothetical protein